MTSIEDSLVLADLEELNLRLLPLDEKQLPLAELSVELTDSIVSLQAHLAVQVPTLEEKL